MQSGTQTGCEPRQTAATQRGNACMDGKKPGGKSLGCWYHSLASLLLVQIPLVGQSYLSYRKPGNMKSVLTAYMDKLCAAPLLSPSSGQATCYSRTNAASLAEDLSLPPDCRVPAVGP